MKNDKNSKICDLCQYNTAITICYDCPSYFCESCFNLIHNIKINSEHKNEEIDPFVSIHVKCSEHPKIINNLFCLEEKSKKCNSSIILFL